MSLGVVLRPCALATAMSDLVGKIGKLEDGSRIAERSDPHCTHSAPPG